MLAVTFMVYAPVLRHDFVNFDDDVYATANPNVQSGLSASGVRWAFSTFHGANWHPVTWISHMADWEAYGAQPELHHLTSVLFHVVNALLLALVLHSMTGAFWRSAFVAALFALHPLHVESVAWIAERKDVLSTFFWLLAMMAYGRYARSPGVGRYLAVVAALALGLMAKPMLVTLPAVFVLLDYWPLNRYSSAARAGKLRLLLAEKVPFFLLSIGSSCVTFVAQRQGGAVRDMDVFPLWQRFGAAAAGYLRYLGKALWPSRLGVFYPYGSGPPSWLVFLSLAVLLGLTVCVLRAWRRGAIVVGWLWFVITLVPVIGLVQVGSHAIADRYTYVPYIGLFIMLAWLIPVRLGLHVRRTVAAAGCVVLLVLACLTFVQVGHWRNSITLWTRTIAVTSPNCVAHNSLGGALHGSGRIEEAAEHFAAAIRIKPRYAAAHYNLGLCLETTGRQEEAIRHFEEAVAIKKDYADPHENLGVARYRQGDVASALRHLREAIRIRPGFASAHGNLGGMLHDQGRVAEAFPHYREALRLNPELHSVHYNMGLAMEERGNARDALHHFREASRLRPEDAEVRARIEKLRRTPR